MFSDREASAGKAEELADSGPGGVAVEPVRRGDPVNLGAETWASWRGYGKSGSSSVSCWSSYRPNCSPASVAKEVRESVACDQVSKVHISPKENPYLQVTGACASMKESDSERVSHFLV